MKIIQASKEVLILQPTKKNDESSRSFIFDIGVVPEKPTPKKIVIRKSFGKRWKTWSMSWKKFLKQTCIGDIVLINKSEFDYVIKLKYTP